MSKKTLTFTEQFYYPEGWGGAQLLQDITMHLANSGFDVRVICGSEPYAEVEGELGPDPRDHGVSILRLPRLLRGDVHSLKLVRQLWFYLLALPTTLLGERPDLFVTQTNPPLLVPLIALVSRARGVDFMVIAQDLYPELVIAHGMMRGDSLAARVLQQVFKWAYGSAAGVTSLGPTMSQRLVEKGVRPERISVISNWATGPQSVVRDGDNLLRREWNLTGNFVVLYSGNLGVAHDIETPLLALREAVKRKPEIRLVIIGKGVRLAEAKALVSQHGLEEFVLFKPLVAAEMLPHSIGLADVALVTLRVGFAGLVVPSKLLGYMGRGIPTIYIGPDSEVSATLDESEGGVNFANGEWQRVADALVAMAESSASLVQMGRAALRYYESHLTRDIALERYADMVEGLSQKVHPARSAARGR